LHKPWMFFWMYAGTVMRMVSCIEPETVPQPVVVRRPVRASLTLRDAYGWLGRRLS